MEKIALLIDAKGVDNIALQYAVYIASLTSSKLTGIFLHGEGTVTSSQMNIHAAQPAGKKTSSEPMERQRLYPTILDSKKRFSSYCLNHGYAIAPETIDVFENDQLLRESRFLDLMIISAEASFADSPDSVPSALTELILKNAECPILIAPISFNEVEEIVFAYDGSASSVFAIKEFTHIFSNMEDKKVIFLEVNPDDSHDIRDQEKITDYLKIHYSNIGYQVLHGNPQNELFGYFIGKRNAMVVLGAFGRGIVSSFLRRSTAELLLKTTTLPIFITHK